MKRGREKRKNKREAGAALLIAIFALLLVSVIAISLVVSSGTDSALQSNYRSSTGSYYAALAGMEEARGRLLWTNADPLKSVAPGFFPDLTNPTSPAISLNNALYIVNQTGDAVDPTNLGNASTYPDTEFEKEFSIPVTAATVTKIPTVSGTGVGPGPLYKWVRITGATEKSLGLDVDNDNDATDGTSLLYYDAAHVGSDGKLRPGLIKGPQGQATARQALEITALAVVPPNTQKLMQYVVTPLTYGLYFHAALVVPGSAIVSPSIQYVGDQNGTFKINGTDGSGLPPAIAGCTPNSGATTAFGVSDFFATANKDAVKSGIPATPAPGMSNNYVGQGGAPSVDDVFVNGAMRSPDSLNGMVQKISSHADAYINKNATEMDLASSGSMSQSNPMTLVVNGNLTINSNFTGYGLLVVTGDLVANADFGWKGVVLVVGSGNVVLGGGPGGASEFDGAFLVAHTLDTTTVPATPLAALGVATINTSQAMGRGIFYNSCWVEMALRSPSYQILSFRTLDATP
jgi:hypothetical protein